MESAKYLLNYMSTEQLQDLIIQLLERLMEKDKSIEGSSGPKCAFSVRLPAGMINKIEEIINERGSHFKGRRSNFAREAIQCFLDKEYNTNQS